MKLSGTQFDDRIVEVAWEKSRQNWRFLRFRDAEKENGNHESVVENIIQSIQDGVEVDVVSHIFAGGFHGLSNNAFSFVS